MVGAGQHMGLRRVSGRAITIFKWLTSPLPPLLMPPLAVRKRLLSQQNAKVRFMQRQEDMPGLQGWMAEGCTRKVHRAQQCQESGTTDTEEPWSKAGLRDASSGTTVMHEPPHSYLPSRCETKASEPVLRAGWLSQRSRPPSLQPPCWCLNSCTAEQEACFRVLHASYWNFSCKWGSGSGA